MFCAFKNLKYYFIILCQKFAIRFYADMLLRITSAFFVVDHFVLFLLVDSCVPGDMVTITGVAKVTTSEESKKINV